MVRKIDIIKNYGYSLLDITVAAGLFAFMMLIVLNIFQSINEAQKTALSAQNTQENLRYTLEVMSKEIRQAVRSDGNCSSGGVNRVYNRAIVNLSGRQYDAFYFKKLNRSSQEICVYYFVDNGRIKIYRHNKNTDIIEEDNYITPEKLRITNFNFDIFDNTVGVTASNKIQPRINVRIGAEILGGLSRYQQSILVQTTVSSRLYSDVTYFL